MLLPICNLPAATGGPAAPSQPTPYDPRRDGKRAHVRGLATQHGDTVDQGPVGEEVVEAISARSSHEGGADILKALGTVLPRSRPCLPQ